MAEKVIFFGNERLASGVKTDAPILRSLIENGYDIPFIVVSQKATSGRKTRPLEVVEVAEANNIEVKSPDKLAEIADDITSSGARIAVLAAYGKIIPKSTIDLFELGILNIHPSLLPAYRGSTPIESAILDGADTGVSLMTLTAGMDEGPVYGFAEVALEAGVSKQELYEQLVASGVTLLEELMPKVLDGTLTPMHQDSDEATYTSQLSKDVSEIDWSKPAVQIEREVRAYLGWPGSTTAIADKQVTITEAKVIDESGEPGTPFAISKSQFGIYCGKQALEILKLKPAGKAEMPAQAFLAGNKID